ncbi:MAG: hypothetical protein M1837_006062 [Sclerophora amabilis]|nr:MAG: hypothetical protein M1837_006062 [Sclerophora amabilis]
MLTSLKLAQLKHLAVQCGLNSSGTKTIVATRLEELMQARKPVTTRNCTKQVMREKPVRILSIDMGIRNLAYCILETPIPSKPNSVPPPSPSILAWKRIAIAPRMSDAVSSTDPLSDPAGKSKENFEPATYASHAYALLSKVLLPHAPTSILIERQRYRSMGSSAILEWTVRVNMLEGMLYAVLRTLHEEGKWNGTVEGVSPARVTSFWVGDTKVEQTTRTAKTAKAKSKGAKIDLVGAWLRAGDTVRFKDGEARQTRDAFLQKWSGEGRRRAKIKTSAVTDTELQAGTEEEIGKLDDLADCLLQAMAHVRWQENRQKLIEGNVDSLM